MEYRLHGGEDSGFVLTFPQTPTDVEAAREDGCELFRAIELSLDSSHININLSLSVLESLGRFRSNGDFYDDRGYYVYTESGKYYSTEPPPWGIISSSLMGFSWSRRSGINRF